MYYTYVLHSEKYNKIYIGYTSNLDERLKSHNELGQKGWTIKFRPWTLVFFEKFDTKSEATKREIQLKSAKGREYIWSKIKIKTT